MTKLEHVTLSQLERLLPLCKTPRDTGRPMTIKAATAIAGSLGYPSKMPGTSYGISAHACHVGAKLAKVPGSVCFGCYALKGNYKRSSVTIAHERRIASLSNPAWTMAMVTLLTAAHKPGAKGAGWHRWHDSGDLQSIEHLTKICAVASATPHIRHWLPTRELAMVTRYVANGGTVPQNLTIRVSATMVDGNATKAWPTTSGVHHKSAPPDGTNVCPAPTQGNECRDCRACWQRGVEHVSYHKH
jgi:Gene product 88